MSLIEAIGQVDSPSKRQRIDNEGIISMEDIIASLHTSSDSEI